jgi:hypothetical protein
VTLTAAILGYGATSAEPIIAGLALYVIVAFAVLDSYYLLLERKYRELFARSASEDATGYSLAVGRPAAKQILGAMHSPAVVILSGMTLIVTIGVGVYLPIK